MVTFEAVGNGGKEQLRTATRACESNGVSVVHREEYPAHGVFKMKLTSPDIEKAQAAVKAAQFHLVFFD